jgi:hypothetical protein
MSSEGELECKDASPADLAALVAQENLPLTPPTFDNPKRAASVLEKKGMAGVVLVDGNGALTADGYFAATGAEFDSVFQAVAASPALSAEARNDLWRDVLLRTIWDETVCNVVQYCDRCSSVIGCATPDGSVVVVRGREWIEHPCGSVCVCGEACVRRLQEDFRDYMNEVGSDDDSDKGGLSDSEEESEEGLSNIDEEGEGGLNDGEEDDEADGDDGAPVGGDGGDADVVVEGDSGSDEEMDEADESGESTATTHDLELMMLSHGNLAEIEHVAVTRECGTCVYVDEAAIMPPFEAWLEQCGLADCTLEQLVNAALVAKDQVENEDEELLYMGWKAAGAASD